LPISDSDLSALIPNQTGALQLSSGLRDSFTAHNHHVGNQLLRHGQLIRCQTIQAQQQPPAELLVNLVVVPIADRGLRHLGDHRLGVAQQQMHGRTITFELILEQVGPKPESVPRALHNGPAGRGIAPP